MKTIAIIPAGGKGLRSGFTAPKQYQKFFGKELIAYTLQIFQQSKQIDEIIVSVEKSYFKLLQELKVKNNFNKISKVVEGGKKRQSSVYNALLNCNANDDDLIVVHDAARPLLPHKVLTNAISAAKQKGNAVVCLKAKDTLVNGNQVVDSYIDRDEVYYVQTPQIFPFSVLVKAMDDAYKDKFTGTDESVLVKKMGEKVNIVEGSVFNFKITTADDAKLFEMILQKNK